MHPSARHVTDVLRERGVTGQVRELPDPAPTAATAAAQLGCEVGAIANSLVFSADGGPLLVLTSGAHRVDTGKVAALVGAGRVKRADPEFVREATGQVIGGVAAAGAISRFLAADGGSYRHVVASRDYHVDPGAHFSAQPDFSASWPPHCVAGTAGAEFHPEFDTSRVETVFSKGAHAAAYSAFEGTEAGGAPLGTWLRERGVDALDV